MESKNKDKKRLACYLEKQTKTLQKKILDLSELVIPQSNYPQFRSKILGITNDFRREVDREIELNYSVSFDPRTICEDIVEITNTSSIKDKNK